MSQKYHHLKVVSENAEHKIKTLSKRVQDKENEIEKLVKKLEKYDLVLKTQRLCTLKYSELGLLHVNVC